MAESRADGSGQIGGEGEPGEEPDHEHRERQGIGAMTPELGPGGFSQPREDGGRPADFRGGLFGGLRLPGGRLQPGTTG